MLTVQHIVQSVRQGDWMATIDLKDAFFHVSVQLQHRKFLRFAFEDRVWEFSVLAFGLVLSPWAFSAVIQEAMAPLRR